jgi:hypothetical protein
VAMQLSEAGDTSRAFRARRHADRHRRAHSQMTRGTWCRRPGGNALSLSVGPHVCS